jgi:hypothetical protein
MKKIAFYLILFIGLNYLVGCAQSVQHSDIFYNFNSNDFPMNHLPLIKPIEVIRVRSSSPWSVDLMPYGILVLIPNSQEYYGYYHIEELEKFAVSKGVVMAYSLYVDEQADAYIQDNYYHWFVVIPKKEISVGFHMEDEFDRYIQILGIQNPDWQTPNEAFDEFAETGCLDWIPGCNQ